MRNAFLVLSILGSVVLIGCEEDDPDVVQFQIVIENLSSPDGTEAEDGTTYPLIYGPGAWATFASGDPNPLFTPGASASPELEEVAERGDPAPLSQNPVGAPFETGVFQPLDGENYEDSPLMPGATFTFYVEASDPGTMFTFASMFIQSNDVVLGTEAGGIPLIDNDGNVFDGDATGYLVLWDAGTEVGEAVGIGPTQAPRQQTPDGGVVEDGVVTAIDPTDLAGFEYPAVGDTFRITISEYVAP